MLTFLFLLKMRIMDLVPQNAFFVWNLLGLLPAPNIEFEDDFDKVKQAPLPGPLGSGVATGVPCPGGKAARPDTCFMTHRYVPRQWETSDESHIHHSLLSLILESLITLSTLYKFKTLSILWLTFALCLALFSWWSAWDFLFAAKVKQEMAYLARRIDEVGRYFLALESMVGSCAQW